MVESNNEWVSNGTIIPHLDDPRCSCVASRKNGRLDELHICGLEKLDGEMLEEAREWLLEELEKK